MPRFFLAERAPALRAWVERQGWEVTGEPVLASYDPPWTLPWRRRNEVHVPVRVPRP